MCAGILLICQFTPPLTLAQNAGYEVKGVVVDKSGMPILGATVVEKVTTNGVSTGIDGDYAIRAAGPESVIEVSYVGYKTVSLVASSSLLAHLTLEEDAMGLSHNPKYPPRPMTDDVRCQGLVLGVCDESYLYR